MTLLETLHRQLEYMTKWYPSYGEQAAEHNKAIAALRSAIERVEKEEPVAWMHPEEGLSYENHYTGNIPLYLHPQPRQWVGLTREEIERCLNSNDNTFDFAADLDEVLRQKNGG